MRKYSKAYKIFTISRLVIFTLLAIACTVILILNLTQGTPVSPATLITVTLDIIAVIFALKDLDDIR